MEVEHTTEEAIDTDKITKEEKESATPSSFQINIKCINSDGTINGLDNIRIEVKRTDLIAAVKQKYIDTGKCTSPDYIVLQYNGKELSDDTTVMENDLREDCTVFHQYSNINPFSKVNYEELAKKIHDEALAKKDYHHAGFDPVYGVWDREWNKGSEWETYPTVMVPDQEEMKKRAAIIPKQAPFNPHQRDYPDRVFKSMFVSVVGGFIFEVMHRMEGKWSGNSVVASDDPTLNPPVTTCDLRFDTHGYWIENRSSVDETGLVATRSIRYTPIGNGKFRVDMSDGMYQECKIEMVEASPYLLITTAVDSRTGKPLLVETVTIMDSSSRVRTIQDFSASGRMTDVFVMNETRIMDPSASALAPYETDKKTESI